MKTTETMVGFALSLSLSLDNNNSNGRRLKCNRTDLPKNVICVWVCAVWPTQTHQSTFYLSLFNWKSMVVHSIWWAWLWIIGLRYWLLLSHFHFHLVAICSNFMWYIYVCILLSSNEPHMPMWTEIILRQLIILFIKRTYHKIAILCKSFNEKRLCIVYIYDNWLCYW